MAESLTKALEMEKGYEWNQAAEIYRQILEKLGPRNDFAEAVKITDLLARSYFKAAFQSETRQEFKKTMGLAEQVYEKLARLYEKSGLSAAARLSNARVSIAKYWLTEDASERKKLAEESVTQAEEAAATSEKQGDKKFLAEAHKDVLNYVVELYRFVPDWTTLRELYDKALQNGEKAIREFEELGETEASIECLNGISWLLAEVAYFAVKPSAISELEEMSEHARVRLRKITQSETTPYISFLANEALSYLEKDPFSKDKFSGTALSASKYIRDKLMIGRLLAVAGQNLTWASMLEEEAGNRRELLEKELEFAERAIQCLNVPFNGALLDWAIDDYAAAYTELAMRVDIDVEEKKQDLRKAIDWSKKAMAYKDHVAWPGWPYCLSKALYFLATLTEEPAEKKRLLEEARSLREEDVRRHEIVLPYSWNMGASRNYLALVKAELSKVERDHLKRDEMLKEAVSEMDKCLELCSQWATFPANMRAVAIYNDWYGDILYQLYLLNREPESAERSIRAYEEAIDYQTKSSHIGPIGQLRWKIATVQDTLADYKSAVASFTKAAEDYRLGAEKIPGLAKLFQELSSYMDAWSLIEEARIGHNEDQFLLASEKYSKVAEILRPTNSWHQLSKHYVGCSFLERGEALSREEKLEESIESFTKAVNAFADAKREVEEKMRQTILPTESVELKGWLSMTEAREKLCVARTQLEEAKMLDRQGREEASAGKYRSASKIFNSLLKQDDNEQSRNELETLMLFCDAWTIMKDAETKGSPEMYSKAANSFASAERTAAKKTFRLLALGNASICRALEHGTRFRRTRDTQLYSEIKKQLETATDYYQQAGLKNEAEWTRATGKLFDALVYMTEATSEKEAKKKTELYQLAEKHLQLAAKLYGQSGFATKKDEALKHLERVREEKELLITPMEALEENPAITGTAVGPVSLVRDQAVGVERFEIANVVGNLSGPKQEIGVGSDFTLELELANVGKTPATLLKLEGVVVDGIEIDKEKVAHRVEDNYLDMKGKRLDYLKTHEVKIPLKAKRKGVFQLGPRILFVDEKGNYRSFEFEPTSVTVKELGISGWLKGPK